MEINWVADMEAVSVSELLCVDLGGMVVVLRSVDV